MLINPVDWFSFGRSTDSRLTRWVIFSEFNNLKWIFNLYGRSIDDHM